MDETPTTHESNSDELHHEPVNGYPAVFGITIAVATLYLIYIFVVSL
jgi:hypothetical protein